MTSVQIIDAAKAAKLIEVARIDAIRKNALACANDQYEQMLEGIKGTELVLWVALKKVFIADLLMNETQMLEAKMETSGHKAAKDQKILVVTAGVPKLDDENLPNLSVNGQQWRQQLLVKQWIPKIDADGTDKGDWSPITEPVQHRGFCESAVAKAQANGSWLGGFEPVKLAYGNDGKQIPAEATFTFSISYREQKKRVGADGAKVYLQQTSRNLRVGGLASVQAMPADYKFEDQSDLAD
jgi:hypothetical protein